MDICAGVSFEEKIFFKENTVLSSCLRKTSAISGRLKNAMIKSLLQPYTICVFISFNIFFAFQCLVSS